MDLTEDAVEIGHATQRVHAQGHVHRVSAHEGEVGEIPVAELELDLLSLCESTSVRDLLLGFVDRDDACSLLGHCHRVGATA
jgi:hypothetical protein